MECISEMAQHGRPVRHFEGITDSVEMLHSSIDARDGTDCLQKRCRRVQAAPNEAEPLFDEFVGWNERTILGNVH